VQAQAVDAVLRGTWRDLTLRRAALVVALCFVVSTQVLFNATMFADLSLAEIASGWFSNLLDTLFAGAVIALAVTIADNALPEESWWRLIVLLLVVLAASLAAQCVLTWAHYPPGYYPDPIQLTGDALRYAILASLITLVYAVQKRNAHCAKRLQQFEIDRISLDRRMLEAELQVMEAQIEPHFLFNTLATVKRLYRTEPRSGERMLESLKRYLETALPQIRGAGTTLGKEFELVRAYLEVLQIRMGKRLAFGVSLPVELAEVEFPSMMLITLVENSIKHGLNASPDGGSIELEARVVDDELRVCVSDTGVGFQASSGCGIGLSNIRSRLAALYGPAATLQLESNEPTGVIAAIAVPMAALGRAPTPIADSGRMRAAA
jgi:signal transduction histidine kinase